MFKVHTLFCLQNWPEIMMYCTYPKESVDTSTKMMYNAKLYKSNLNVANIKSYQHFVIEKL